MKRCALIMLIALLLMACPGGWRTVMISTYALDKPKPGEIVTHEGYIDEYARPAFQINDILYVQMRSDNYDDLGIKTPLGNQYEIEVWLSATEKNILIDSSSFVLQRENEATSLSPLVLITEERGMVNEYGRAPYTVCDFRGDNAQKKTDLISIPRFKGEVWPPESYGDDILCMRLVFTAPISEVPPQNQFQLSFQYIVDGQPKNVTLYFYPLKYTVFRH